MKTFHSFLLFALLACVLKGCVAQGNGNCCPGCSSANSFDVSAHLSAYKCSSICSGEIAATSLSVSTTNNANFSVYTINEANYNLYLNNDEYSYLVVVHSEGNQCVSALYVDGKTTQLYVLVSCDNETEDCELESVCQGFCNPFPTTAPPTTAPTTAPTTTTTTAPHSISSRLGSSISGGLMFLIAFICAVLSF